MTSKKVVNRSRKRFGTMCIDLISLCALPLLYHWGALGAWKIECRKWSEYRVCSFCKSSYIVKDFHTFCPVHPYGQCDTNSQSIIIFYQIILIISSNNCLFFFSSVAPIFIHQCTTMHLQEARGGKRPLKIWDSWRNIRKGLVVGSFEELLVRGMNSY